LSGIGISPGCLWWSPGTILPGCPLPRQSRVAAAGSAARPFRPTPPWAGTGRGFATVRETAGPAFGIIPGNHEALAMRRAA